MNAQEIIAKADRGEGLTEEEIRVYREAVKPVKHTYGKYGTLAKKYLEEENVGKYWAIENLPEYLHGIDRQADELYETMYAKLSQDERYKRTGKLYGGLPQTDGDTKAHRGRNTFRACVCGLKTEVQDESCFRNREGVAESVIHRGCVYRNRVMNFIGAIICAITE